MLQRLRSMIDVESPEISDSELEEIENMVNFDDLYDYEYSGNFSPKILLIGKLLSKVCVVVFM